MDSSDATIADGNFMPILTQICTPCTRVISPELKALVVQNVSPGAIQYVEDALGELMLSTLDLVKSTNFGTDKEFTNEFVEVLNDIYKDIVNYPVTLVALEITKLRNLVTPKKFASRINHLLIAKSTSGSSKDVKTDISLSPESNVVTSGITVGDVPCGSQKSDRGPYVKRELYLGSQQSRTSIPKKSKKKPRVELTPLEDPCLDTLNVAVPFLEVSPVLRSCVEANFSNEMVTDFSDRAFSKSCGAHLARRKVLRSVFEFVLFFALRTPSALLMGLRSRFRW